MCSVNQNLKRENLCPISRTLPNNPASDVWEGTKNAMLEPSSVSSTIPNHIKLVWSLISQSGVTEVGATPLLFGLCPWLWQTAVIFTPEESLRSQLLKKKNSSSLPPTPRITPFPSFKCCFFESEQINIDLTCLWQPKWLILIPLRCCHSRSTQEKCRAISLRRHHQRRWTPDSTHFFNIGRN